jgi:hypothetical protein
VENHSRTKLLERVLDDELRHYAEALDRLGPVIPLSCAELPQRGRSIGAS